MHARIQHTLAFFRHGMRSQCHNRQIRQGFTQNVRGGIPIHDRHLNIHQHQVVARTGRRINGFLTIANRINLRAGHLHQLSPDFTVEFIVIHQQNATPLKVGDVGHARLILFADFSASKNRQERFLKDRPMRGLTQKRLHIARAGQAFGVLFFVPRHHHDRKAMPHIAKLPRQCEAIHFDQVPIHQNRVRRIMLGQMG